MSVNWWIYKHNVVYHTVEQYSAVAGNEALPHATEWTKHHVKWKKSVTTEYILCDQTKCPEETNPQGHDTD